MSAMRKTTGVSQVPASPTDGQEPASRGEGPARGRPRINAKKEEQIRQRLQQGAGVAQIRRETGAGFSAITRIKSVLDSEQEVERHALLVKIANAATGGTRLSPREAADLIFRATGIRLKPKAEKS